MKQFNLSSAAGFEEWRLTARECLFHNISPYDIVWTQGQEEGRNLFAENEISTTSNQSSQNFKVSKEFVDLAVMAACHSDNGRFDLLYRILWRLKNESKHLLRLRTDNDIIRLYSYVKAVRRDAYKIKAFLRFRETQDAHFIAWYEPEHYTLQLSLPFFQIRFRNMNWSILTPYLAAHWDQEKLLLQNNPDPSQYPKEDQVETYWLKYYASTFNPARIKKQAMLNQMPKKYWKNMPETTLIEDMLRRTPKYISDIKKQAQKAHNLHAIWLILKKQYCLLEEYVIFLGK